MCLLLSPAPAIALAHAAPDPAGPGPGPASVGIAPSGAWPSVPLAPVPLALPDLPAHFKEIESIRMLSFKEPVLKGTQSLADFRRFVQKDIDHDLPPPRAACVSRSLGLLGLLPEPFDLRKAFTQILVTQVAAYYNPYKKTFFIVHPDLPDSYLKPTVIHELTHALQDQQFGLEARIKALRTANNNDRENAFRFLAEGEATYVMMLATLRAAGVNLEAGGVSLEQAIEATSGLGREGILAQVEGTKASLGPSMAAEVDAVLSYPDYLFRILFDPYFSGQKAIHHVFSEGGWDAVNGLWTNPPVSTEMFLHPEKLENGRREEPVSVTVPDLSTALGPGYSPACENTLGELEIEILFEAARPLERPLAGPQTNPPPAPPPSSPSERAASLASVRVADARKAAAGWGGDRYRAFERSGGGTVVVWKSVWDTERDAIEFEHLMRKTSRARLASWSAGAGGQTPAPEGPSAETVTQTLDGWIAPAASSREGVPAAGSALSRRGFLLVRRGKEALFVAGADVGQARAVLTALAPPPADPR